MKQVRLVGLLVLLLTVQLGFGHGGHPKKKARPDSTRTDSVVIASHPSAHSGMVADSLNMEQVREMAPMPAPLAAYPTYHPMVVHIPIVLLILAGLLQVVVLVKPSPPLQWLTLLIAAVGTGSAILAGTFVHPHTDGLSEAAQVALETHETYADYTLWLGLAGTLMKGGTLWRPWKWLEGMTAVTLIAAGIAVGLAGHQGGALTYLYGIGPRGAYLQQHQEGHADGNRHEHKHPDQAP